MADKHPYNTPSPDQNNPHNTQHRPSGSSEYPLDKTPKKPVKKLLNRLSSFIIILGLLAFAGTWISFFGKHYWLIDLFSNIRLQYTYPLVLAVLITACKQKWFSALLLLVALLTNIMLIASLYQSNHNQLPVHHHPRPLQILHMNLNHSNTNTQAVIKHIENTNADMVFLQETTTRWLSELQHNLPSYNLEIMNVRPDAFGMACFARKQNTNFKIISTRILDMTTHFQNIPAIEAVVSSDNQLYTLLSLHTLPPISANAAARRNDQLNNARRWLLQQQTPALIIGDLNATPFTYPLRQILSPPEPDAPAPSLASQGFGYQGSWPASLPAPLRIPIDHAILSPNLITTHYTLGPNVGSDHLPLLIHVQRYDHAHP